MSVIDPYILTLIERKLIVFFSSFCHENYVCTGKILGHKDLLLMKISTLRILDVLLQRYYPVFVIHCLKPIFHYVWCGRVGVDNSIGFALGTNRTQHRPNFDLKSI